MMCGKLVLTLLLAVFVSQQYSSASPIEEVNKNANSQLTDSGSSSEVSERFPKWKKWKWGYYQLESNQSTPDENGPLSKENLNKILQMILGQQNSQLTGLIQRMVSQQATLSRSATQMALTDCIGLTTDFLKQGINFLPQLSQLSTNTASVAYYFIDCIQAGFTTTTAKCLQNLGGRIQDILSNTAQQDRELVANYGNALNRLLNCINHPGV